MVFSLGRLAGIVFLMVDLGRAAWAGSDLVPLNVPTDPKARYWVLEVDKAGTGQAHIVTKRVGPSGTSFARRRVDCQQGRFQYVGEGDTLAELENAHRPSPLIKLVEGSISYYVSRFACRAIGAELPGYVL